MQGGREMQGAGSAGRVNREVFRRAAGRHAETAEETVLSGLGRRDQERGDESGERTAGRLSRWAWALLLAGLAAALLLLASWF